MECFLTVIFNFERSCWYQLAFYSIGEEEYHKATINFVTDEPSPKRRGGLSKFLEKIEI